MKNLLNVALMTALTIICFADEPVSDLTIAQKFGPSLVRVEYTLQSDNSDNPEISGKGEFCPNCGGYHWYGDGSEYLLQERPFDDTGYVLAADKIITQDPMIQSRFIKKIEIRYGDTVVSATPLAYIPAHTAVILKPDKEIAGVRPITFTKSDEKALKALIYSRQNEQWTLNIKKMSADFAMRDYGKPFRIGPTGDLIIDSKGNAIGLCFTGVLPMDDSWQMSPLKWPSISSDQMEEKLTHIKQKAAGSLLRVKLNFRSPKKKSNNMFDYHFQDDNEQATEMNVVAALLNPTQILILTKLQPKVTARLEQITVFPESGEPVQASFKGTLKDYGALVATLETSLNAPTIRINNKPIADFERETLYYAEVRVQGESKTIYVGRNRIASFETGWHQQLQPMLPNTQNRFLFDQDGKLIAFPMSRRKKIPNEEDRWMFDGDQNLIAGCYLQPTLLALEEHLDPDNKPLTAEQESRIAWLGVELQAMNEELARINNVSNLTHDGEIGAIVSYVYDNSPASKAGLEIGDILLRFHIANMPQPMDISLQNDYSG